MEEKPKKPDETRSDGKSEADQDDINAKLDVMVTRAKADKAKVAGVDNRRFEKWSDFYTGDHWKGYHGSLDLQMTHNRIRENIETVNALVNEMNINAEFQPREPNDEITAELKNAGLRYIIESQDVLETEGRIGKTSLILGTGIGKVYWNPEANGGKGDVVIAQVPPQDFYVEPGAATLDDARFCFYERWMDVKEVKAKWKADVNASAAHEDTMFDLPADDASSGSGVTASMSFDATMYPSAPADHTASLVPADSFMSGGDHENQVLVQEFFVRETDRKKWPNGRMIVRAGKKIVEDKPNPYDHGMWPYYTFVCEEDPKRIWGDTFVRHAIPLQKELNIVASTITLNMHLGTATLWANYSQSGVSDEFLMTYGSTAGAVLPVRIPGYEPKRIPPPPIQGNLFEWYDRLNRSIDEVMRVEKVVPPGSRGYPSSGEVITKLQEVQLVAVRQIAGYRARGVQRRTMLVGAVMQQFYAADRYVRLLGPLPRALEGLKDPETGKPIARTSKTADGKDRDVHYVQMNPDNMAGQTDTRIVESTYQPLSKKAEIDLLLELNERDPEAVPISAILEIMTRTPSLERLLRKTREREDAAAAAPPEPPMAGGMPPIDPMTGQPMMPQGPPMMPPMGGM